MMTNGTSSTHRNVGIKPYRNLFQAMNFKIEIEEDYQELKKLQKYDVFLMEKFVENGYVGKDLKSLYCKIC
jgi:hypothetical protein